MHPPFVIGLYTGWTWVYGGLAYTCVAATPGYAQTLGISWVRVYLGPSYTWVIKATLQTAPVSAGY